MSAFYIGQRVRVVCVEQGDSVRFLGAEGRIVERRQDWEGAVGYGLDIAPIQPCPGGWLAWGPHQLEPIIDPGRQLVEWSDCLWQPEGQPA